MVIRWKLFKMIFKVINDVIILNDCIFGMRVECEIVLFLGKIREYIFLFWGSIFKVCAGLE